MLATDVHRGEAMTIYRDRHPVVGFGDAAPVITSISKGPLIGVLVGATGGAIVGALVKKGVGAAVGIVVGGLGGVVVGSDVANAAAHAAFVAANLPMWQRVQETNVPSGNGSFRQIIDLSALKAGQQIAVAVGNRNGATLPPDQIAQLTAMFATQIPANIAAENFVTYPPGAQLPNDWPKDDDLGANAYRVMEDMRTDAPRGTAIDVPPTSMVKLWMRQKPI